MKRAFTALVLLIAAAAPAAAGDDWYDRAPYDDGGEYVEGYVVREYYSTRRGHDVPVDRPHVFVPYGSIYADYYPEQRYAAGRYEPDRECTIKRRWRHGVMTEKIKCEDD